MVACLHHYSVKHRCRYKGIRFAGHLFVYGCLNCMRRGRSQKCTGHFIVLDPLGQVRRQFGLRFARRYFDGRCSHYRRRRRHRSVVRRQHRRRGGRHFGGGATRRRRSLQQLAQHRLGRAVDDALPAQHHAVHETVARRHKAMFHVDGLLVPVDDARRDAERAKGSYEAPIADGRGALDDAAAVPDDGAVELGAFVEVDARKVDFAQIAGVVHVVEERVQVGGDADAWKGENGLIFVIR